MLTPVCFWLSTRLLLAARGQLLSSGNNLPAVGWGVSGLAASLHTYTESTTAAVRKQAHAFVNSIAMASSAFIGERHMRAAHPGQGERTACMHSLALLLVPSRHIPGSHLPGVRSNNSTQKDTGGVQQNRISRYVLKCKE